MKTKKSIFSNEVVWKKYLFVIAMLIVPIVHFAFFYVYINASAFLLSFQYPLNDGSGIVKWGFDNYITIFSQFKDADSTVIEAITNTMIWFVVTNFVCMPLSLVICYFTYKKIKHYTFFRTVIYLPCIMSGTILVVLFKYMTGWGGPLYVLMEKMGLEFIFIFKDPNYAMNGMLFYTISTSLGGNFVLFGGTMNSIPTEQIEAGKIDGCGPWRELISIIIPNIWPTLGTIWIMGFTSILSASGPVYLFTNGDYGTQTLSFWIFDLTMKGTSGGDNLAAALGMLMSIVTIPIVLIVKKITGVTKDA